MQSEFTCPYRRFSDEMYAQTLVALLEEHEIPYEIHFEPEGMGTAILGQANQPGLIVMVRESDAQRILGLEKELHPEASRSGQSDLKDEEESIAPGWLAFWYALAMVASPVSMFAGFYIFTTLKRKKDFTKRYAFDKRTRFHGKLIFFFGLFMIIMGFVRMTLWAKGGYFGVFSLLIQFLRP